MRQLDLGHQPAGYYTDRTKAAYWDGRNEHGESVASGIYFYQLRAGGLYRVAADGNCQIGAQPVLCFNPVNPVNP